ncbi:MULTISPECIES: iron uptake transporter deferrochelatase/peroxidase subunit [unclassified Pseudofrankia]|uniref:iron uptake transporter deferrochelatase/peroxidase subunit n=1 Tax=unclassified Pseudofrankia TaxID=2994372 RepID=UPI0008DA3A63|nr:MULTISPECIES: iron uptake transporter deferrochelatase/peroxidase subunit [unclassified Pseudofrankia]MDT3438700.1 iron uptake transporter deferrochelatase/peroxidase subunit [Pseudofrankia sp. BMG5.37]OHV56368.1 peroxidase [Pseudofrankia sp. BMG5.36]
MAGTRVSRRGLFGLAGVAAAGAATAGGLAACSDDKNGGTEAVPASGKQLVEFHGAHQAGIVTPAQDRLHFAAFDVVTDSRADLVEVLKEWTAAAAAMAAGKAVGDGVAGAQDAPPDDTGEAEGLASGHLTLTFGVGPTLFTTADGVDRFGLASRRPAALVDLPAFSFDALDPARCGGDLAVQACADDPQIAVHAVRNLARIGRGVVAVRWSQLGFGRTASTSSSQATPRNLMGFKDGTNNIHVEQPAKVDEHVWVAPSDEKSAGAWMAGGSYMVTRRIQMLIERWDRTSLAEQETTFGRTKVVGAPFGHTGEFDAVDLKGRTADGELVIPADAHIRLASPDTNGGHAILRRGYSFTDGSDGLGHLDAGLFFIAFQRDPRKQFIPIQTRLASSDALNEYIEHTGSAIFAVPPGVAATGGDYWGRSLFT